MALGWMGWVYGCVGAFIIALGLYVLWRERGSFLSINFFAFVAPLSLWMAALTVIFTSREPLYVLKWIRIANVGICFIPAVICLFCSTVLGRTYRDRGLSLMAFGISIVYATLVAFSPRMIPDLIAYPWGYYTHYHPAYLSFLVFMASAMAYSIWKLWTAYRATRGRVQQRLKWVLIGLIVAYLTAIDYLPAYGVPILPLGVCATAGFFIIFSYAILRFRLIEVTPAVAADQVLTTMKEGVAVCDAAGKILMTNRELQRVIGVEEKFLLNRHIGEIVQLKADGLLTVTALSQLSRGRSCLAFWKHDSGALLPIELSVCAIEDEDRRVGYVLIARDITEQMHMEAQLLKLSRAVNQSGSMIIITDANWRIEYANQKVIEVTGYQLMDLLGRNPRILKSGIMPPSIYKEMWDALLAGREWHGEFSNKKKNGELFWVFANISPIRDGEGKVTHYLAIEEDITDRKRSEQLLHEAYENLRNTQMQLIQAAKMESVGRLSAGVAHEVKNPLAITLMGIEYLRNSLKPLDPQISEVLEDMLAAVRRADRVIRGLLDFSSPRKVQLHPAHLNLVVEEAVQMMKYDFGHSHVHVDLQLKDDLPLVQLDTYKMEQVLVNLFMNATHAMEGGGELTVRTLLIDPNQLDGVDFKVNLGCFKVRCPHVALLVEDTGRGIPEDQLESIFDPFFTTKPTGKGTGLGLTVVRSMVEMHNGSIYFENRSLGGALAIILLPVYNSASQYNGQG